MTRRRNLVSLLSPLAMLVAPVLALVAPATKWYYAVVYSLSALLIYLSYHLYRALTSRTGRFTALAGVSLLWGVLSLISALVPAHCPTSSILESRCSPSEVASATLLGLLLPVFPFIVLAPIRLAYGVLRALVRLSSRLRAKF